jgi:hypothetical protein
MQRRKVELRRFCGATAERRADDHQFEKDHAGGDCCRRQMNGPRACEQIGHAASGIENVMVLL